MCFWPSALHCHSTQSLQNKSYNHFAAIYYLLVERLKAHRCSFPVEQRLDARQRRPSTIAEQTVVKVCAGVSKALGAAYCVCLSKQCFSSQACTKDQLSWCEFIAIMKIVKLHFLCFLCLCSPPAAWPRWVCTLRVSVCCAPLLYPKLLPTCLHSLRRHVLWSRTLLWMM